MWTVLPAVTPNGALGSPRPAAVLREGHPGTVIIWHFTRMTETEDRR
jgi:hypothetical protein